VALSHYCCRPTLQCQCHETVLKLSVDRLRQPKQYSLEFTAEGEQGRHVPDMTRQRIPGSCCSRRKRAVTQCRTASCRHQQSRRISRSEMTPRSKAGNCMCACMCAAVCVFQNYLIWLNFVEAADDKLFRLIDPKDNHILSSLLQPKSDNRYNLSKKHHNRELLPKTTHLFDCNFIVRLGLLYKDCY